MPLDPADLQEIKNLLQSEIKQIRSDLEDQIERNRRDILNSQRSAIDGLKEAIAEVIDENVQENFSKYSDDFEFLREARQEYESGSDGNEENTPELPSKEIQLVKEQLEAQLADYRKKMEELSQQSELEKAARIEAEKKALVNTQRSQALEEIRKLGIVNPGKEQRLLSILEQDGQLKLTEEGYRVPGKNKFGDEVQQAIADALPILIESSYDEYSIPRGGTGTGSQPASRNYTPTRDFSGLTAQQMYDQMRSDPAAEKDLLAALEEQYRK